MVFALPLAWEEWVLLSATPMALLRRKSPPLVQQALLLLEV
jgi:hypothetical protein